jgi:hypothetical protein
MTADIHRHDQFKTNVLAQAATADWSGGVMENWSDASAQRFPNTPALQRSITPFLAAHPAYTAAYGQQLGIIGPDDTCRRREGRGYGRRATDIGTAKADLAGADPAGREGGVVELDLNLLNPARRDVNIYSGRDGDADFKFLARDIQPPYVDNRPMLVAGKPELREHKAVFVIGDQEFSQFSDEITVNCAPLL